MILEADNSEIAHANGKGRGCANAKTYSSSKRRVQADDDSGEGWQALSIAETGQVESEDFQRSKYTAKTKGQNRASVNDQAQARSKGTILKISRFDWNLEKGKRWGLHSGGKTEKNGDQSKGDPCENSSSTEGHV